jgi:predicted house-cleaning NTP pyrophosphatase (Maf/HAM1 superfamily)
MLSLLSGKAHTVHSGLSVRDNKIQKEITEHVKTTENSGIYLLRK